MGIDSAIVTPFRILATLPPLYKSTIMSSRMHCFFLSGAGSSIAKGNVDTEARSIMNALVTLS